MEARLCLGRKLDSGKARRQYRELVALSAIAARRTRRIKLVMTAANSDKHRTVGPIGLCVVVKVSYRFTRTGRRAARTQSVVIRTRAAFPDRIGAPVEGDETVEGIAVPLYVNAREPGRILRREDSRVEHHAHGCAQSIVTFDQLYHSSRDAQQDRRSRRSGTRRTDQGEHAGADLADAVTKVEQADCKTSEDDAVERIPVL